MQYACQRNYALLTTDGYWNINSKDYKLDTKTSTRVGNQDSTETRLMWDGTHNTVITTTVWTAPATQTQLSTKTATITWTLTGTVTSKSRSAAVESTRTTTRSRRQRKPLTRS